MSSELSQLKKGLKSIEGTLREASAVELGAYPRAGRTLHLMLTERFRKRARKARMWGSKGMLTALKNAAYGFDPLRARSRGGSDGIFLVDRDFQPTNEMIRRLFDGFIDKEPQAVEDIATHLGVPTDALRPVRLVSHHTRLLGLLTSVNEVDWLVLVDVDPSKRA